MNGHQAKVSAHSRWPLTTGSSKAGTTVLQIAHLWANTGVVLECCPSLGYNVESTESYTFQVQTGWMFYFPIDIR